MSETGIDLPGGDVSGADTFSRFRYQSKLTLLHWLGTLTPNGPNAVYAEHVEDILLEFDDRLVFIQVKTRVPSAGSWTADSMCAEGGGIDSLCRAYAIARDQPCTFSLHLEGPMSPAKVTTDFVRSCATATDSLRTKISDLLAAALGGSVDGALDDFLARLNVVPNQPSQNDIDARCFRLLARLAPDVPGGDVEVLHRGILNIVEHAQEARPTGFSADATGIDFLEAQMEQLLADGEDAELVVIVSKRLTRERLASMLPSEHARTALLLIERVLDDRPLTALEEKLLAAGASNTVVLDARQLRAMTEPRRMELLSGPDAQLAQLDDVSNRVLMHARAVAQLCRDNADPPNDLWAHLMAQAGLETTDQAHLFNDDRQSLLGLLCCLSDECKFAWVAP
jgi:Cap4 dsDNA endonuclease